MTEPIWLYLEDGTRTKNVACGTCRMIALNEQVARACCEPRKCARCQEAVRERYWTVCTDCRRKREEERERETFDAARKVSACDWDGPVVVEYDDYFSSIDEMIDRYMDDDRDPARYVWGTRPDRISMDADRIVEQATEEMPECVIDYIDSDAVAELQKALDAWVGEHGPKDIYIEDRSIAIIAVPWREGENDS
jgi:hypothetical protein